MWKERDSYVDPAANPPAVGIIDEDSRILFDGEDLVKAPEARMREIREMRSP